MCWLRGRNEPMLHLRTPPFAQLYIFWGTGEWFVTHLLQRSSKFSVFPALVFLFLHTWIWLLATMMQSIAQSTSGAGWGLSILRTFSVQRPKPYTHVISTATTQLHLWVLLDAPWAGDAAEGGCSYTLGEFFPCWMTAREGTVLALPWQMFWLHPEHMSQIFPCSQDNFSDKGLFNSSKSWRLFYTTYNCQIFTWLTSEFKHTLVVQRCD